MKSLYEQVEEELLSNNIRVCDRTGKEFITKPFEETLLKRVELYTVNTQLDSETLPRPVHSIAIDIIAQTVEDTSPNVPFYLHPDELKRFKEQALEISLKTALKLIGDTIKEYVEFHNPPAGSIGVDLDGHVTGMGLGVFNGRLYVAKSYDICDNHSMFVYVCEPLSTSEYARRPSDPNKLKGIASSHWTNSSVSTVTVESWRYNKIEFQEIKERFPEFFDLVYGDLILK